MGQSLLHAAVAAIGHHGVDPGQEEVVGNEALESCIPRQAGRRLIDRAAHSIPARCLRQFRRGEQRSKHHGNGRIWQKAYLAGSVKPLSLRLGYGFAKITSNLLLAKRLPAQSQ